jgi:hypothetical protein
MFIWQLVFNIMKKIVFVFLLLQHVVNAQFVGTPYIIPIETRPVLDQVVVTPSFAFSTRKLREAYTGFAVRIRRSSDNAQADVAFDDTNVVSNTSIVTLTTAGSSGLSVGSTYTLSDFRGGVGATFYVSIWYDQGTNGYNALQNTASIQPILSIGSAGSSNQYASISFSGLSNPRSVIVNQTLQTLLGNVTVGKGLRGTLALIAKTTSNSDQFSFGYSQGAIRWSAHMNWSDGNCYVDLGTATDGSRAFSNTTRVNFYKNYIFIRGNNFKTMRASGTSLLNNGAMSNNAGLSGGSFGIGNAVVSPTLSTIGFTGNIPEFILFPEPLTVAQYSLLENNQISFWGAN